MSYVVKHRETKLGEYDLMSQAWLAMQRAKEHYDAVDLYRNGILINYARKQPSGRWVTA